MNILPSHRAFLPLILATLLLLSACGRSTDPLTESSPSDLPESNAAPNTDSSASSTLPPAAGSNTDTPSKPSPSTEFYVAEVSQRNDDGTLLLTLCRPAEGMAERVENFADAPVYDYVLSDSRLTYTIPSQARIARAEQGSWHSSSAEDLAVGDRLIIYSGEDNSVNIAHYAKES